DRVAQRAERILLGCGPRRATAKCARHDLNEKACEIHVSSPCLSRMRMIARCPVRRPADDGGWSCGPQVIHMKLLAAGARQANELGDGLFSLSRTGASHGLMQFIATPDPP